MGCTQSKIENEEAVSRCRDRKQHMKDAVSARNAFAAAHSSYATYLKNTGAALSDFAQAEVQNPSFVPASGLVNGPPVPPQQPLETLRPPPPPHQGFPNPPPPLQRAATMPEMMTKGDAKPIGPTIEEEDENDSDDNESLNHRLNRKGSRRGGGSSRGGVKEMPVEVDRPPKPPSPPKAQTRQLAPPTPPPPQQDSPWDYFFSMENMPGPTLGEFEEVTVNREDIHRKEFEDMPTRIEKEEVEKRKSQKNEVSELPEPEAAVEPPVQPVGNAVVSTGKSAKKVKQGQSSIDGKKVKGNINLLQVFADLDDHFLKASESAHEISKMLEATRLHYHSNFADNRGDPLN